MPRRDVFEHGTPCWVDLASTDDALARDFYSSLFGWEWAASVLADGETYWIGSLDGSAVAGLTGMTDDMADAQMPSAWFTYISVDGVEETVSKAKAAGAKIVFRPQDVADLGRMAFIEDPWGASLGMWQAAALAGSGTVGEAGTMIWNEIYASETDDVVSFYSQVFGWERSSMAIPGGDYTTFMLGDATIGGTAPPPREDVSPQWHVWFGSDDVAESVAHAQRLGGTTAVPPTPFPEGQFASLQDPTGAAFSIITPRHRN